MEGHESTRSAPCEASYNVFDLAHRAQLLLRIDPKTRHQLSAGVDQWLIEGSFLLFLPGGFANSIARDANGRDVTVSKLPPQIIVCFTRQQTKYRSAHLRPNSVTPLTRSKASDLPAPAVNMMLKRSWRNVNYQTRAASSSD